MRSIHVFVLCVFLAACIPDQQDPGSLSDAGRLNAGYYASALGNIALKVQSAVVGDPDWFKAADAASLDLAVLGIDPQTAGARVRSQICPTGTGAEVVLVTWLDSRDARGRFELRGIGSGAGAMLGALRSRASTSQIGTVIGPSTLGLANGLPLELPGSCANLGAPSGAPVLVFRIERPAPPVEELARTEYRTVACGNDERGLAMRGTKVESRVVRYTGDGVIVPSDAQSGWSTETIGTCAADAVVSAESTVRAGAGSVSLGNFADVTAQGFKRLLERQLEMDCGSARVRSDVMTKDTRGSLIRRTADKSIDTCVKAAASASKAQTSDSGAAKNTDRRDLCEDGVRSGTRSYLGISTGTYIAAMAGAINVDRVLDNRTLSSTSAQVGQRERWIGQDPVSCRNMETYIATCGRVPGAPPRSSDFNAAPNRWNGENIKYYFDNENWFNEAFNICLINCTYIEGGELYTLNWNYFREQKHVHSDNHTTTAKGGWSTNSWADRYESFTVNFSFEPWIVPAASNQCRVRFKELPLDCPLKFDALKQGEWNPTRLSPTQDFLTTLIPGGSYEGKSGKAYDSARARGDTPGVVTFEWKRCNIKGCESWTERAGPGTDAYIRSWSYSDTSSVGTASASVQTILLNKEPQMYDLVPAVSGVGREGVLKFSNRMYLSDRGLHCGRVERRTFDWPVVERVKSWCFDKKKGLTKCVSETRTMAVVTEVVTREWYGDSRTAGTWSRPVVRYLVEGGVYATVGALPNPIVRNIDPPVVSMPQPDDPRETQHD